MNIYIAKLSYDTTNDSLKQLFENYGEVTSASVITDRETGRSRGFGFVEMPDDSAAKKAIESLDNTVLEGRTIAVTEARPKTEKNDAGSYNKRRY